MKPIPLKTVRPFIMREIKLSDVSEIDAKKKNKGQVIQYLMSQVEEIILEAKEQWIERQDEENRSKESPLPLVRLRVRNTQNP